MEDLTKKHCVPCEGGIDPLTEEAAAVYIKQVYDWDLKNVDEHMQIEKIFEFPDFKDAMIFSNKVAQLAESEGHHPNFEINYNKVKLVLFTHAIIGLHENDFILAAKINQLS